MTDEHSPATLELTVGKVAGIAGVPTDVLRGLCERGHIRARRGTAGTWYLNPADVPDRTQMRGILGDEYRAALQDVQAHIRALNVELEALNLDCDEALHALDTDPHAAPPQLGADLTADDRTGRPMLDAVHELMHASVWVRLRHRDLLAIS